MKYIRSGLLFAVSLLVVFSIVCSTVCYATSSEDAGKVHGNSFWSGNGSEKVEIYSINREGFQEFLNEPTIEKLTEKSHGEICNLEIGRYKRSAYRYFTVKEDFLSFACGGDEMKAFLSQNGIDEEISEIAVIDSDSLALVIWVQTSGECVYITVDEANYFEEYEYRLYTNEEFREKFLSKEGRLLFNLKEIKTENHAVLYHNYGEVPFCAVLTAMGAKFEWKNDTQSEVLFRDEMYVLDLEEKSFYKKGEVQNFIRCLDGGKTYIYPLEKELMVDTTVLTVFLAGFFDDYHVTVDSENAVIDILVLPNMPHSDSTTSKEEEEKAATPSPKADSEAKESDVGYLIWILAAFVGGVVTGVLSFSIMIRRKNIKE